MKIITEEKIKVASENYSVNRSSDTGQIDFKAGVNFAETELQNIAIEFAEWVRRNGYHNEKIGYYSKQTKVLISLYSTSELFTKFITERSK